jgi:DNA-binding PadR family transcriptional regulator
LAFHKYQMYHSDTSKGGVMRKASALELAILGLIQDAPLHGYELRKRLTQMIGTFRAISFGALYPALRILTEAGHISQTEDPNAAGPALSGKRARITYAITEKGQNHLTALLKESGPETWDDEGFGVRLAFFSTTEAVVRRRILEGRRSRLDERRSTMRQSLSATREKLDRYTLELHRHGLEGVESELRWIDDLIAAEDQSTRNTG